MTLPFYRHTGGASHPIAKHQHANVGLWFTRFYNAFDQDWKVGDEGKRGWIQNIQGPAGDLETLKLSAERLDSLGAGLGAEVVNFKTDWHFATGMGISHPVENGFTWHHTLGVPYLPASGVKGMLQGWVRSWMEHADEESKERCIKNWFGADISKEKPSDGAGNLIFFDALPIGLVNLACDVMTPHMGAWYAKGGEIKTDADYASKAPADWHNPNPIPFLVVKSAEFKFMIAPRLTGNPEIDAQSRQDAKAAMVELEHALEWIGAGAKTAAGYGRMRPAGADRKRSEEGIKKASGIAWQGAKVTWDKGKQVLTVQYDGKKSVKTGVLAKADFDALSDAAQKRLKDGKKPLIVDAVVDKHGNLYTLLGIKEVT